MAKLARRTCIREISGRLQVRVLRLAHLLLRDSSEVERRAHNPKVLGSNPSLRYHKSARQNRKRPGNPFELCIHGEDHRCTTG